jgi:sugar/nucleoside kinase (ribokinase family)
LIASIGELVLDVTVTPEGPLRVDDDRDASVRIGGGGQAANFCAWAASLGERARLVTKVGEDETGRRLVAEMESAGVEVMAARGPEPTGAIAVLVGQGGRSFARQRGAATSLRPEELQAAWFEAIRLLHVPAYSLFREPMSASARHAIDLIRVGGGIVSIDLSSAADLRDYGGARMARDLARLRPELLFATEQESAELGAPLADLATVPVVKLGPRGCLVLGRRVPAPRVDVVDVTGAGDALAAAFCVAYLEGATPLESAGRAVLVAARAVAKPGARP